MAGSDSIKLAIDDYLEVLAASAKAYEKEPRPLGSAKPAVSIESFFGLVQKVVEREQGDEGAEKPIIFGEDYSDIEDNLSGETITHSIEERRPGIFKQVNVDQIFSNRQIRQRHKVFRESRPDPDHVGGKLFIYGQWYDNLVEFKIWAKTSKVANLRALWLEDTLEKWEWFLQAEGVSKMLYMGRLADQVQQKGNKKIACRTLQYYVRTERLTIIREQVLRNLVVTGQKS
jgi:hypothetical protein